MQHGLLIHLTDHAGLLMHLAAHGFLMHLEAHGLLMHYLLGMLVMIRLYSFTLAFLYIHFEVEQSCLQTCQLEDRTSGEETLSTFVS